MPLPKGPAIEFREPQSLRWSIIVPVHRHREGLRRCLDSVLPQLKPDMELLVIDHSDDHADVFGELPHCEGGWLQCQEQYRLKAQDLQCHIEVAPTGSMAGDWNRAVSYARGEWIQILHDDDWMLLPPGGNGPGYYDTKMSSKAVAFYSGYRNVSPRGHVTFERDEPKIPHWPSIAMGNFLTPSCVSIKRSVYEELGGYLTASELRHCPDWEFYVRASEQGQNWSASRHVLVAHAEGGDCETEKAGGGFSIEIQKSLRAAIAYMNKHGLSNDIGIASCGEYYKTAVTMAVDYENLDHFWSAVEFNRLAVAIGNNKEKV